MIGYLVNRIESNMGPLLVALLVGSFFVFAVISACVAAVITLWTLRLMIIRNWLLAGLILVSGFSGLVIAILIGFGMQWNIVGGTILKEPILGYFSLGIVGFAWPALGAFLVGSFVATKSKDMASKCE